MENIEQENSFDVKQEQIEQIKEETNQEILKKLDELKAKSFNLNEKIKQALYILGYILTLFGSLGYLITLLFIVFGAGDIDFDLIGKDGLFFIISLAFGQFIRGGLMLQGVIYSKQENKETLKEYYELRAKKDKNKKVKSFEFQITMSVINSTLIQVGFFIISNIGLIYIAGFPGMQNWVYLWNGISSLTMFLGFGFLGLNSTYEKYNTFKIPRIKEELAILKLELQSEKKNERENTTNNI